MKTIRGRGARRLIVTGTTLGLMLISSLILFWLEGAVPRLAIGIVLLKLIGLASSVLLVLGELGHPVFLRVCPDEERPGCQAVLDSPAARLFGILPLADLGMLYFGGSLLLIIFSVFHPYFYYRLFILVLLNLTTLPYTLFSVLYQGLVVKRWCVLCLIVQLIFWLEFVFFFKFLSRGIPPISLADVFPSVWSFALPALIWAVLRRPFVELMERRKKNPWPSGPA